MFKIKNSSLCARKMRKFVAILEINIKVQLKIKKQTKTVLKYYLKLQYFFCAILICWIF